MRPDPDCRLCGLCEGRTNMVLPHGDATSGVILVGEAPGENEDLQGRPFVGRSGKILDGMLAEEGLDRSMLLITNTVKCRPPGNRDPTREEMAACRPFLDSELRDARLVVGLGKSACRDLMGFEGKMSEIVNVLTTIRVDGKDVPFLPTYHPAATIYNRNSREELRRTIHIIAEDYL